MNRLAKEKSPYLLQHAHNPVDWYAWGLEAFEKARKENKPILLSIGYSTCHWCHVMEKESFEDAEVANIMNEYFVNIKVDREEMPDIDNIYMTAVQAMTGSGGWPLNVFLTPDLKPFYGDTYFPPVPAHGRPSWSQILERIHKVWIEKTEELTQSADQLTEAIKKYSALKPDPAVLDPSDFDKCQKYFVNQFDRIFGGFGSAPKFPRPSVLYFLTRHHAKTRDSTSLEMVTHTLRQMARGGIYDQLGGGFSRYSVDEQWLVPHFEKMLYDNAQLVVALCEAYQLTQDDFFMGIAKETLAYVQRDMTHVQGGFYSAEDADSEGVEGKFYVWSQTEIENTLGLEMAKIFNDFFGVTKEGHFQEGGHSANILHQVSNLPEIAQKFNKTEEEIAAILQECAQKLFNIRSKRIRPHRDDKILTSWNGLMISAFAKAAQIFHEPSLAQPAINAAQFIESKLYDSKTKQLKHRWRDGQADDNSFQTDYAFFIQGLLDLYETVFDPHWLEWAIELNRIQTKNFYDRQEGGFFMTPENKNHVLVRMKVDNDNAEPSGNSIALLNLIRLNHLTSQKELKDMADKTIQLFAGRLKEAAFSLPQMAAACLYALEAPIQIIVAGNLQSPATREFLKIINTPFIPFKTVLVMDDSSHSRMVDIQPFLKSISLTNGKPLVYVCQNFSCKLPMDDPFELKKLLEPLAPPTKRTSN